MKYERLTKEQFEELHQEFINFLATQSITAAEWQKIKSESPEVAEQELDVFSDLIWEGVLQKVAFVEIISEHTMQLFKCHEHTIQLIAIKIDRKEVNLLSEEGFKWFKNNLLHDQVELFTASKQYTDDKYLDIFNLIKQGGQITNGALFTSLGKTIGLAL